MTITVVTYTTIRLSQVISLTLFACSLFDYLTRQIIGPSRSIHPVGSCSYIKSRLNLAVGKPQHRSNDSHVFPQPANEILVEKFRLEKDFLAVLVQPTKHSREQVLHVVVMTEDGCSITLPHIIPNVGRICADTVDKPL